MSSKNGAILVLDDEENYAEMLKGLLEQNQFIVDMATRPEEALEALEEKNFELVISDYKMPIMDGAVFLKKAREIHPGLPIILVSGLMNTPELVKVANMSVTMVMEKPLDTDLFIEQVRRFVTPTNQAKSTAEASEEMPTTGEVTYTYPQPTHVLSDESAGARSLLQGLRDIFENDNLIFLLSPKGGEVDLVVEELVHWMGSTGKPVLECSVSELLQETVREQLRGHGSDGEHARVLLIEGLAEAPAQTQSEAVDITRAGEFSDWFFLFTLPAETDAVVELHTNVVAHMRGHRVAIAELHRRPGDIAKYALAILEQEAERMGLEELPEIDPEVLHCLLQCRYKENYHELERMIRQLVEEASQVDVIDMAVIEGILRAEGESTFSVHESLLQLLQREQMRILREAADLSGKSMDEVIEGLKLGREVMPETHSGFIPLLFPNLLRPE